MEKIARKMSWTVLLWSLPCSWRDYVRLFICAFFADARIYLMVIGDRSRGLIDTSMMANWLDPAASSKASRSSAAVLTL